MMDSLIQEFPEQLLEALEIGRTANLRPDSKSYKNVLVCGLGGSGIGANFVYEFCKHELKVPFQVVKGYDIPAYVNEDSLVICSSYSGNTEETVMSLALAQQTGAKIVIVTSGGKLLAAAKEFGYDFIQLPAGKPSPRACLGYSFVQQLFILKHFGMIGDSTIQQVEQSVPLLKREQADMQQRAKIVANGLFNKMTIIYTTDRMESVAVRFRQQLNENSKVLCWHHVIPEMNHNELVGWRKQPGDFAVVIFRNKDDFDRNQARVDVNKEIISEYTDTLIELWSKGENLIERSMYFVHLGDWVTWYLAELRQVDAVEVKAIDYLKGELAKV